MVLLLLLLSLSESQKITTLLSKDHYFASSSKIIFPRNNTNIDMYVCLEDSILHKHIFRLTKKKTF